MSEEEEKPKKKKLKKITPLEESKPTKKKKKTKSKKKKKVKTELDNNFSEQDENEEVSKPKKKKTKKKSKLKVLTEKIDMNDENESENEEIEKPKKKKKKKKKKTPKEINTEEDMLDDAINNRSDTANNKDENDDDNNESQNEDNNNLININRENENNYSNNDNDDDFFNDANNNNIYDEREKEFNDLNDSGLLSKQEEEEIKEKVNKKSKNKGTNKNKNKISYKKPDNSHLKVDSKNKQNVDITKSAILNLFSTKTLKKVDSDYEEVKDDKKINSPFKNSQFENGELNDDNQNEGTFINLLSKINNLDYQGYNYTITEKDYFKRTGEEPPITTILNSEDAAIKKCEELMEALENEAKWSDPDFGPQPNDNGMGSKKSIYGEFGSAQTLGINVDNISWYGIKEINENATFFYDGTESNDVLQGALGDCWFISALSVIATKDYLLRGEFNKSILEDGKIDEEEIKMMSEGIYPPIFHSFSTKGIFCFRFYKNFQWRYVLIDDRLPCYSVYNENQTKKLVFAHCRLSNEFWVPLIEKAYAKLHGSYASLVSGCIDDGLVDMTD